LQESRVTGREFEKLARKHLLPHLPGVALKGGDLYALPVDRLWRRFEPVRLGFSRESFTIVCSVSPLYVPETIHAYPTGLGDRLPILAGVGDRWWEWTPAAEQSATEMMRDVLAMIQDVGVPFLNKLATPEAVAQNWRRIRLDPTIRTPSKHLPTRSSSRELLSLLICLYAASDSEQFDGAAVRFLGWLITDGATRRSARWQLAALAELRGWRREAAVKTLLGLL
jgi:hypothetical protein